MSNYPEILERILQIINSRMKKLGGGAVHPYQFPEDEIKVIKSAHDGDLKSKASSTSSSTSISTSTTTSSTSKATTSVKK